MPGISDISSLLTQRYARMNGMRVAQSFARLASGRRIMRGADDPAGLIASEQLRATLASLEAESRSLQRNDYVATTADAALSGVSDLLSQANGLAVANANDAGLSDAEKQANQVQIDSIVSAVDRISSTSAFNGAKLLDGSAKISAGNHTLAIDSVASAKIGKVTIDGNTYALTDVRGGGAINSISAPESAQKSIAAAISNVSTMRAKIGAFQKDTIGTRLASIDAARVQLYAAESAIADTDFAAETSHLVRSRLMEFAALGSLKKVNKMRGLILNILG